jgi:hypothetical protein
MVGCFCMLWGFNQFWKDWGFRSCSLWGSSGGLCYRW